MQMTTWIQYLHKQSWCKMERKRKIMQNVQKIMKTNPKRSNRIQKGSRKDPESVFWSFGVLDQQSLMFQAGTPALPKHILEEQVLLHCRPCCWTVHPHWIGKSRTSFGGSTGFSWQKFDDLIPRYSKGVLQLRQWFSTKLHPFDAECASYRSYNMKHLIQPSFMDAHHCSLPNPKFLDLFDSFWFDPFWTWYKRVPQTRPLQRWESLLGAVWKKTLKVSHIATPEVCQDFCPPQTASE